MNKEINKILIAGTEYDIRDSRFDEASQAETARQEAETARQEAEQGRVTAEQQRADAEAARAEEFATFEGKIAAKEDTANKVTSIGADANNTTFPTTRAVLNSIAEVKNIEVTPEMLSESTKQYINASGGGTITNLADNEDLTSVGNVLKLADKDYSPTSYSGMGRVYLRKNIVDGKNILTQEMMTKENTIYIIQYDYDLNGATINVPANCTLDFQGGSLANGTLSGSINIQAPSNRIFNNIVLSGYIVNDICDAVWFGISVDNDDNSQIINSLMNQIDGKYGKQLKLAFGRGVYEFKDTIRLSGISLIGCRPIMPMDYVYTYSQEGYENLTIFHYNPSDKGVSIEINETIESLNNEEFLALINSEKEAIFIDGVEGQNIGGYNNPHSTLEIENIDIVAANTLNSLSKNDIGYNMIAFKYKGQIKINCCRIRGFNKALYFQPTQYSRVTNVSCNACYTFIYMGFANDAATTFVLDNVTISNAECVVKTLPKSSKYTSAGIKRIGCTDLTFRNATIQGCNCFIMNYDGAISNISLYNTYYEANKNGNDYLIKYIESDYLASAINNSKDYAILPKITEFDAFSNGDNNVYYIEYGIVSIIGGYYMGKDVLTIGDNKNATANHFALSIQNSSFYNNIINNSNGNADKYAGNIYCNSVQIRSNGNKSVSSYMSNIVFGTPAGYVSKGIINKYGIEFLNSKNTHLLFAYNGSTYIGGTYEKDSALNGLPSLSKSFGIQSVEDSIVESERIDDTTTSSYGGLAIRSRKLPNSNPVKYAKRTYLETNATETYPFSPKNTKKRIVQQTESMIRSEILSMVNSAEAYMPEFRGYNLFAVDTLEQYVLCANKLFQLERLPVGVSHYGDKLPDNADISSGFIFINKSNGTLNVLSKVGTPSQKQITFSFSEGVSKVSGQLEFNILNKTITIELSDDNIQSVMRKVLMSGDNKNSEWRFSNDNRISNGVQVFLKSLRCKNNDPINAFVSGNIKAPEGMVVSVVTNFNGKAHEWITYQLQSKADERPTLLSSDKGFQFFDTTLNKPIWWTGSAWVDATGQEV